jgi:hypothetical protein
VKIILAEAVTARPRKRAIAFIFPKGTGTSQLECWLEKNPGEKDCNEMKGEICLLFVSVVHCSCCTIDCWRTEWGTVIISLCRGEGRNKTTHGYRANASPDWSYSRAQEMFFF